MSELTNQDVNIPRLDTAIMLIGKYSAYDEQEFREDVLFLIRQSVKVESLEAENLRLTERVKKLTTALDEANRRIAGCLCKCDGTISITCDAHYIANGINAVLEALEPGEGGKA